MLLVAGYGCAVRTIVHYAVCTSAAAWWWWHGWKHYTVFHKKFTLLVFTIIK